MILKHQYSDANCEYFFYGMTIMGIVKYHDKFDYFTNVSTFFSMSKIRIKRYSISAHDKDNRVIFNSKRTILEIKVPHHKLGIYYDII